MVSIFFVIAFILFKFLFSEDSKYHKLNRYEHLFGVISNQVYNSLAKVVYNKKEEQFSISVKPYLQENALTCEVASLRSALAYQGVYVTEDELLEKLTFDTKDPITVDGVWGDPERGFVGDVNGSIFKRTGFGVYEKPIRDLALNYRYAEVIENADLYKILGQVKNGNPVIVWGLLSRRAPVSWNTKDGRRIEVMPGEHARVVAGFTGKIDNPSKIILIDPIYGRIFMETSIFLSDWEIMDNRAVVVY